MYYEAELNAASYSPLRSLVVCAVQVLTGLSGKCMALSVLRVLQFRAAFNFVPLVFKEEESFVCSLSGFNSGVLKKKLKSRKDRPL